MNEQITTQPKVYVLVISRWGQNDRAGCLYDHEGEPLWEHMSSSLDWLKRDLTDGFPDRATKLAEKYPDGYEVIVVDGPGTEYDALVALWDAQDPNWRNHNDDEKPLATVQSQTQHRLVENVFGEVERSEWRPVSDV